MTYRKKISRVEQDYLWSESGGHCQNPVCRRDLHTILRRKTVSELAHIIPASIDGPRGENERHLNEDERAAASNILVLCPTCHTMIDKDPAEYPTELLRSWKAASVSARTSAFGTPQYETRMDARERLESLLAKNRAVFEMYGPQEGVYDDDRAHQWAALVKSAVIPVNAQILAHIRANEHLLTPAEVAVTAKLELHIRQFEERHLYGDWSARTIRFPQAVRNLFREETA
ncbi:HNH endonuclease [Glutamicibacter creatinolyticus]|uniref:HNH endonuclease n=1 Tax=Glutamicibacter creatinolyticus TaxID=162496 RepID=UPI001586BF16|nr:HNH endonuclease [Glutamicibacter creatinolyticus]